MRGRIRKPAVEVVATAPRPSTQAWVRTPRSGHLAGRRSRDTAPEILLRQALHALGARFRLHNRLARGCTPDLLLPSWSLAIFVDGDFWHGCPKHGRFNFQGPNRALWEEKLARNAARDANATRIARDLGWTVVRLWECEVMSDVQAAARHALSKSPCRTLGWKGDVEDGVPTPTAAGGPVRPS